MLYPILISIFIGFIVLVAGLFQQDINLNTNLKDNRKELYSGINNNSGFVKRISDKKIDYVNNQLSRDFLWSFNYFSTGYSQYQLNLIDYTNYTNAKLYVSIYTIGYNYDILDAVDNNQRIKNNTNNLGNDIDLDNVADGIYIVEPDSNNNIIIKGTDVKKSLSFMFLNDNGSGIIWQLSKQDGDDVIIDNIIKQNTRIGKQQYENFFQANGFNGIVILNN